MRKSVAHLRNVSPLLSQQHQQPRRPRRPLTGLSSCCWQTHLHDMLQCFDEPLLLPRLRLTKLRYQQQRHYTHHSSRFYSSSSSATIPISSSPYSSSDSTTDVNERSTKSRSNGSSSSPSRLYGALAIFNWTDHIALSDLEKALTKHQAEKSWQLFCTLTSNDSLTKDNDDTYEQNHTAAAVNGDENGDDMIDLLTVPYHHCAQLYTLLLYAQDLSTHPNVIALRQQQLDKVATYVKDQLGQSKRVFLDSISRRPVPTYKRLQQALRHNHRQSAWQQYTRLLKDDPAMAPRTISRNHYLKLLSLILGAESRYLNKHQKHGMVQLVTMTHQGIPCQHGRILTAGAIEWIARIYSRYDHNQPKAGRKLVNTYLDQMEQPTADAVDELVWRILPFDFDTAHMILTTMHNRGLPQNESTYCNLIKAYTSARMSGHALEVFEQMLTIGVTPTVLTFNAVIHLFANQGLTDRAVYMWDTLLALEVVPDAATFSEMIRCFGHAGNLKSCLHYYHLMIQQQQQQQQQQQRWRTDSTNNTSIHVVAPNVYTYSTLIEAFGKQNDVPGVLKWFQTLLRQGLAPNQVIMSNVLKALGKHYHQPNMMEAVRRIAKQCMMAGVKADTTLYTLLLTLQATATPIPRTNTPNSGSISSLNQMEDDTNLTFVLQSHREMLAKCVEPNVYTYTALIDLCGKHGYLDTAQQIFDLMQQSDQHQPTTATFCAMIEVWHRANRKDQVDLLLYEFLVQSKSNGYQGNYLWMDAKIKHQFRCYHGC